MKNELPESMKSSVKAFLKDNVESVFKLVKKRKQSYYYNCFTVPVESPVGEVMLNLDYRIYRPGFESNKNQLRFELRRGDKALAQMYLRIESDTEFILSHRYVQPEFRGRFGLGGFLFGFVEDWVRYLSFEQGQDVLLRLETGQKSVIAWALKVGFDLLEEDRLIYSRLDDYEERFVEISDRENSAGIKRDAYLFSEGNQSKNREDAIRLRFVKKISFTQGGILNDVKYQRRSI